MARWFIAAFAALAACETPGQPVVSTELRALLTAESLAAHQLVVDLSSSEDSRIEEAIVRVLRDRSWRPLLRKLAVSRNRVLAFRAGQLLEVMAVPAVSGLRFGCIVRDPVAEIGTPMPGWDIFINISERAFFIETTVQPTTFSEAPCQGGWFV
jgi:hypothetical protein